MNTVLNLATITPERFFIVGELRGSYARLIHLLFHQRASYKDVIVFTGNLIDPDVLESLQTLHFIKNMVTTYSVKGVEERNLLALLETQETENLPIWLRDSKDNSSIKEYLAELPSAILLPNNYYVVSAGMEPIKSLYDQDPDAFVSIGEYDKDSKYYQFENPEGKSWYQFEFYNGPNLMKICSGTKSDIGLEAPAGYLLGRDKNESLKCLILKSDQTGPIFVEA